MYPTYNTNGLLNEALGYGSAIFVSVLAMRHSALRHNIVIQLSAQLEI